MIFLFLAASALAQTRCGLDLCRDTSHCVRITGCSVFGCGEAVQNEGLACTDLTNSGCLVSNGTCRSGVCVRAKKVCRAAGNPCEKDAFCFGDTSFCPGNERKDSGATCVNSGGAPGVCVFPAFAEPTCVPVPTPAPTPSPTPVPTPPTTTTTTTATTTTSSSTSAARSTTTTTTATRSATEDVALTSATSATTSAATAASLPVATAGATTAAGSPAAPAPAPSAGFDLLVLLVIPAVLLLLCIIAAVVWTVRKRKREQAGSPDLLYDVAGGAQMTPRDDAEPRKRTHTYARSSDVLPNLYTTAPGEGDGIAPQF